MTFDPRQYPQQINRDYISVTSFGSGSRRWCYRYGQGPMYAAASEAAKVGPIREVPDALKCYKWAYWDTTTAKFFGIGLHAHYGPDEDAICAEEEHPGLRSPQLRCGCGFYGFDQNRPRGYMPMIDATVRGLVLLEAEFTGMIVKHAYGYRAEHQRVLGIYEPHPENKIIGLVKAQIEDTTRIPVRSYKTFREKNPQMSEHDTG